MFTGSVRRPRLIFATVVRSTFVPKAASFVHLLLRANINAGENMLRML